MNYACIMLVVVPYLCDMYNICTVTVCLVLAYIETSLHQIHFGPVDLDLIMII